jgi:hypothetical protein
VFQNDELKKHFETSETIISKTAVLAEWNLNIPGNVQKLGNYRYRQNSTQFSALPNDFDRFDFGGFYTGATDADITIESGLESDQVTPLLFTYSKEKEKIFYSLEDCVKPFRPRSGINKLSYFNNKFLPHPNQDMFRRPRYYMPHKDDTFKYWRSYRTESSVEGINKEYGISKNNPNGIHFIDDAVPFVVYKEAVPTNRLVIKVQTNVGSVDLGPFKNGEFSSFLDPLFGELNKTVPQIFSVQYLDENDNWIDALSFDQFATRSNGKAIFGEDGTLELEYGLIIPAEYRNNFIFGGILSSTLQFPGGTKPTGLAYLVTSGPEDQGRLYIFDGINFVEFNANYGWQLVNIENATVTNIANDLVAPPFFNTPGSNTKTYREFVFVKGIRLVVKSMNTPETPLELIELSPRLVVNLTNQTVAFGITKTMSDLSTSSLPVGDLLASVGTLTLFDDNQAFNENNVWNGSSGSIVAKYLNKNIKFLFYEIIENVNDSNYFVPIKTMYSEGIDQSDPQTGDLAISLRDFYFYLESNNAPRILITEASLSQAVCLLLDHIGFSNYVFKRIGGVADPVIPYFFIGPDVNVAEVLADLARSTQSTMFFDEFNNFVVMTKEYVLDDQNQRDTDWVLRGSEERTKDLTGQNKYEDKLANIINIASEDQIVFNDGEINYTTRYIQRSYGSLQQAQYVDRTWIYKPSLLWEVSGTEKTSTANTATQDKYVLGALPLNSSLPDKPPTVVNRQIVDNVIDVGENAYWITRFQGYLYANGEIFKYDAVEYNVTGTGNVWLTSNLDYQRYFANLPFNGKIYPTGNIRIFAEPFFETIDGILLMKNGPVSAHGRGQFGTTIVNHSAGLPDYWSDNANVRGCNMASEFLFTREIEPDLPNREIGPAGVSVLKAQKSQRNGIIRNFLSSKYGTETDVGSLKTIQTGTIQSSALVFNGPDFEADENSRDFVTYVHKNPNGAYKHFGTRMRVIGRVESVGDRSQSPSGSMTYYNIANSDPTQTVSIGGGSGGISLVNPETNVGYYFELAALTSSNLERFIQKNREGEALEAIDNILFYKIKKEVSSNKAIPEKMWGAIGEIIVDDGNFTGQYRFVGDENPTVYDLTIEYVDVNETTRKFYLYINQKLVQIVTDNDPLPLVNSSIGLFVRGTSRVMFENIYALSKNYSSNAVFDTNVPIASIFGDDDGEINASEALTKYAMSGMVQKTYLSGIQPNSVPNYNIYFEEFGTIMRECAYFNVLYDRAFPALYAKIAPTFNRLKGYTVSGFYADSYGAEFLIFNNTDTALNLDETTGNYLRILGVTFTQDTTQTLTVDDYYKKVGSLTDLELEGEAIIRSPFAAIEEYNEIKNSRMIYGRNEFTLESNYIQDQDTAEDLLGWMIKKKIRPRKSVGVNIFPTSILQLGDIVTIDYKSKSGVDFIAKPDSRFVVYNIEYSKAVDDTLMTIYLSEV